MKRLLVVSLVLCSVSAMAEVDDAGIPDIPGDITCPELREVAEVSIYHLAQGNDVKDTFFLLSQPHFNNFEMSQDGYIRFISNMVYDAYYNGLLSGDFDTVREYGDHIHSQCLKNFPLNVK